jgi:hypothetical protein
VALVLDLNTLQVEASKAPFLMLSFTPLNNLLGCVKNLRCHWGSAEIICTI